MWGGSLRTQGWLPVGTGLQGGVRQQGKWSRREGFREEVIHGPGAERGFMWGILGRSEGTREGGS